MAKNKLLKKRNLSAAEEAFEILAAYDHDIRQLSPYHFRVNKRLDIWPSSKKAYDLRSHRKFEYDDLVDFVMTYFSESRVAELIVSE